MILQKVQPQALQHLLPAAGPGTHGFRTTYYSHKRNAVKISLPFKRTGTTAGMYICNFRIKK
jgi:hypothetical protein